MNAAKKRNIKLVLEYDGTDFHGFQMQKNQRTVQGELISAVETIVNEPVKIIAAARTDAGVHGLGQVVNFHTTSKVSIQRLLKGLNALLPQDVAILEAVRVSPEFHARFSAVSRSYIFSLYHADIRSAFKRNRFLYVYGNIDFNAMLDAAKLLIGEKDFSSFRAAGDTSRHSVRRMIKAGGYREGNLMHFYFEANAFLQHMIRNIMGTLLLVGRGKMTIPQFEHVIRKRDRNAAGKTVKPNGLYLVKVKYSDDLMRKKRANQSFLLE